MGMGKHDHVCRRCNVSYTTSNLEQRCPKCNEWMDIKSAPKVGGFAPFWHPTLDHEPVYIDSAKTLDKELEKRGLHINEAKQGEKQRRLPQTRKEALNA